MHVFVAALVLAVAVPKAQAREPGNYEAPFLDPVLEQLKQSEQQRQDQRDEATTAIRKQQKQAKEQKRTHKRRFHASLPANSFPTSAKVFQQIVHHAPVAQFMTGTCWSFSTTSMLESEVQRQQGRLIKLSEIHTVYYEYLEKMRGYIGERGNFEISEGSEPNAVTRIWQKYGVVPLAAYTGLVGKADKHDHQRLSRELRELARYFKNSDQWDEATALSMTRALLDRELGAPPTQFVFEGKNYTPQRFWEEILRVDVDAYVSIMSTRSLPFYQRGVLDVEDNWWRDASYINVPLDDYYANFKQAVLAGYSVTLAFDVSEPGKDAVNDVMFVPSFDIPSSYIDQDAREYRLEQDVTTDDHGVHVVGYLQYADRDWFLVKDSGRSARRGKNKGYYFVRDDYVRLKSLAYMVHHDAVAELLKRMDKKKHSKR